jgi:hypothetical protein
MDAEVNYAWSDKIRGYYWALGYPGLDDGVVMLG